MRYFVTFPSGDEIPVDVTHLPTGAIRVEVEGRALEVDVIDPLDAVNLRIDGRVVDILMEGAPPEVGVVARGFRFYARVESDRMRTLREALGAKGPSGESLVTSPMPGRVLKVLVEEGAAITAGTPLVVVEAMKMENELAAARDGTVTKIFVTPGSTVESGAKLVEIG